MPLEYSHFMSTYSKWFVVSSLLYLLLGGILALLMAWQPSWIFILRFSHIHAMVIGWITLMIFGLGYHVIPRFCGKPLVNNRVQATHWWLANIAMMGMIGVPILKNIFPHFSSLLKMSFIFFGSLQFIGILIFVGTLFHVLDIFPIRACSLQTKRCCSMDQCK